MLFIFTPNVEAWWKVKIFTNVSANIWGIKGIEWLYQEYSSVLKYVFSAVLSKASQSNSSSSPRSPLFGESFWVGLHALLPPLIMLGNPVSASWRKLWGQALTFRISIPVTLYLICDIKTLKAVCNQQMTFTFIHLTLIVVICIL